jgi:hypothetical protein
MANDLKQRPDTNPGQRHEDDLFKHFEDQYHNPTGSSTGEDANIDRANASLRDDLKNDEESAATAAGTRRSDNLAARENEPNYYYKPRMGKAGNEAKEAVAGAKARSSSYKAAGGRRRGVLIGFGAGGGILSIVAALSSILPFKMPSIMDSIIDNAGRRVEKVVERRAERVVLAYILQGSSAAFKNKNVIVTGNPLGDLFANIRTSNFERNLLTNHGLSFESNGDGKIRLVHNNKTLWYGNGTIKNSNEIFKILDEGKSLTRADLRKIVRAEIPAWRFFKRAKFVNWLRIKYDIPRYGAREQEPEEPEEEYNQDVKEEHIERIESGNLENVVDFVDCAAEAGDCVDKIDEGSKITEQVEEAVEEAAEELSKEGSKKASSSVFKLIINKLTASSAAAAIPYVGWVDMAARLMHGLGEIISNDLLQKKHAEYIKRSSAILGVTYAGYADQTKAGDMQTSTVGMFTQNLDGWEESASYGIIQAAAVGGEIKGTMLDPMEKANETVDTGEFGGFVKTMFGTVGWIGRAPLELWYYTVSQLFDLGGDGVAWVIDKTPARELMAQLGPVMGDIFTGMMKLMGMHVDPLETGARLALFIHQGFLGSFNDKAKEDGMRRLTEDQGLAMDQEIQNDRIADMQNESLFTRIFDVDNEQSLATNMMATLPVTTNNPIASLASASIGIVGNAPTNLAHATTATASAAPNRTAESLFGLNIYGALPGDLAADLDDSVDSPDVECPPISDRAFNHCIIDRSIVESMDCVFVKCPELYGNDGQEAAELQGDPLFAYDAQGPLYGPDAVIPEPKYGAVAMGWTKAGGMLAALLPIGALEVSRRRQQ